MTDLLNQLRTLHKLPDDADEAAILAAASKAVETPVVIPSTTKPSDVNLSELATSQGMIVLSAADHLKLATDAASGAAAAKELHSTKFETKFTDCVDKGKLLPAMKATFELSYGVNAEATLTAMEALPVILSVKSKGYTGDPSATGGTPTDKALSEAADEGWTVDDERGDLDRKATELAATEGIDYAVALDRVAQEA